MKFCLLNLLLCLSILHIARAQQVTLNELIIIRSGDLDKANQILLPKGWIFKGRQPHVVSTTEEHCSYDELTWDNQSVLSSAYVIVKISDVCSNYVGYQTAEVEVFYAIRAEVNKYSMKLLKTEVIEEKDGSTWTTSVFIGAKYEVDMSVWTNPNKNTNSYSVSVYLK